MNRTGHLASGLAVGTYAAAHMAPPAGPTLIAGAILTGAAALLPDIDHPTATAANQFGPISKGLSRLLRALSAWLYALTKGPRDEKVTGKHRHLTHTAVFAVLLGVGTHYGCTAANAYGPSQGAAAVAGVIAILTALAYPTLGVFAWSCPLAITVIILPEPDPVAALAGLSDEIGWYIVLGCITHCLGDMLTERGCPLLWPLPFKGETWFELGPPKFLRFRTGGAVESVLTLVFVCTALAIGVNTIYPDVFPALIAVAQR